jgi:hypothetical protein
MGVWSRLGRNVADPDRVVIHEVTHALVGTCHGHGEPWRTVYLSAIRRKFGQDAAERELARIRWVYDKSYLGR